MAISNLGATCDLPDNQIPSGYTKPTVATFSDFQYERTLTINVLKSTVETATPSTTLTAIFNNGTIGINKQITDIVAATFLTTPTVTTYGKLIALSTTVDDATYLTNAAVSYKCTVKLYIKSI